MIISTATELSPVFEETQISGNLGQFSFLHLSLQAYPNNWEDMKVGGEGERLPELHRPALCPHHRHRGTAVPDRTAPLSKGQSRLL